MQSWVIYEEKELKKEIPPEFFADSFSPERLFYGIQTVEELPVWKKQEASLAFLCPDVPGSMLKDLPPFLMKKDAGLYTVLVECFNCKFDLMVDPAQCGDFAVMNTAASCIFTITGMLPLYPEEVTVYSAPLSRFCLYKVPNDPVVI